MKIIIDIGHPAHVHLFKNFALAMQNKGHKILFTCREKEFEIHLLDLYKFNYKSFGRKYKSSFGKLIGLLEFDFKSILSGIKFKPDLFLSCGSMYSAHAAFILGKPHVSLEDTGNWEQVKLYLPFTKTILTSNTFPISYGDTQIRYNSHHEIAYLHPNQFKPDFSFRDKIGLKPKEKFVIFRFVSWNATHDKGQRGIENNYKVELVEFLSEKFKVFISSESPLPEKFKKYEIKFDPDEIHNALYYADFFIGEGSTMAMEAAVLGTPSIYINTLHYHNIDDMVKYNLAYNFKSGEGVLETISNILNDNETKDKWKKNRKAMLANKIDLTTFLIWFIDNYPESVKIMKENPDYQYNFK